MGAEVILPTDTVVTVSVAGGTATAGTDFTAVPGFTIIIPAEMDSGTGTFDLEVNGDTLVEMNETLTVSGIAAGFTVVTGFTPTAGELTIENDDAVPTTIDLSLDITSVMEESGTTPVTVTAAFSGSGSILTTATEVTVSVAPGTTETADFSAVPAFTVTIPANMSSATASFHLPVLEDTLVEGPETVTVSGAATGFTVTDTALTIIDNDVAPTNIALSVSPAAVDEGDSGDTTTTITVTASFEGSSTLTEATVVSVEVSSGTNPGEATVGVHYRSVTDFTVTIPAGMSSGTNTFDWVVIGGGTVFDGDETVTVSGTADPFTVAPATLTISEDDEAPTTIVLSLDPPSVTEGTTMTIAVTATLPGSVSLTGETVVTITVAGGTAEAADFTAVGNITVTIPATMTFGTGSFTLTVTEDTVADPDETLTVSSMTPPTGFETIAPVTLTITDNDTLPTAIALSLSDPTSVAEGASPTVTVTATLSPTHITLPDETVVTITVAGDTAQAADFTAVSNVTVTIAEGATSGTVTFPFAPTDDAVADTGETVTVSGSATDFTITSATLTITDTDTAPTAIVLRLSESSVAEGASPVVTVTATLSPTSVTLPDATVVTVSVAGNTAAAADFTEVADFTITIPAETASGTGTFTFEVTDDAIADPGETVTVSGTAGTFTITSATLTITDTDTALTAIALSLNPASVLENSGTTSVAVTATLEGSVAHATATEVTVSVAADTATAGTDFTAVGNVTVTIPANMLSGTATFQFAVMDDTIADPDETVTVSGTAGTFTITSATLTITDDDTAPTAITLSTTPASVPEGATTTVMVIATLSPTLVTLPVATEVTVSVAAGTAQAADFTAVGNVTVTIAAGMSSSGPASFNLVVAEDTDADPDETLTVSGMVGGSSLITTVTSATLTITDNDTPPTAIALSLSPSTVVEGASPTVTVMAAFPPGSGTLTDPTVVTVVVGDTGDSATEGTDYTTVADLTVTIAAGATSGTATFGLAGTGDTLAEDDETLTVSGSTTATGFDTIPSVMLTITDDDDAPTVIVLSLSQADADEGASPTVTVTATLSPTSVTLPGPTMVTVAVGDSGDTATEGTDYDTVADLTLTITAGATSGTVTFDLAGTDDTLAEEDETLTVSGTAGGFTFTDTMLTITDDDDTPTVIVLSLSPAAVAESTSTTVVTVTATLSPTSATLTDATVVTVAVGAGGDSATEGMDYTAVADFTVTIAAGATSGTTTFDFVGMGDTLAEGDETVTVSGTVGGFTFTNTMLTITDNDTTPTGIVLSLSQSTVAEGASPMVTVTASFSGGNGSLSDATMVTVAVGADTDTATEGGDYTTVADLTVAIAAGARSGSSIFQFAATDDTVADPGETVTVSGTTTATGFTAIPSVMLAITDDDADVAPTAIVLSLSQSTVAEGASPTVTVTATFVPTLITRPAPTVVTVAVGAAADTATEGTDYTTVGTVTVTIPAETVSGTGTFRFAVTDDTVFDTGETVTVSATAPTGFDPISSAMLTITNTDTAPMAITLSATPPRATEGLTTTVTVTATLSPANVTLTADTDVVVSVDAGTATEGTDYTAVDDFTVTIPMGMSSSTPTTFNLVVADDLAIDPDETLTVSGTTTATVITTISSATLTIDDTDSPPSSIILSVDLDPASVDENSGSTPVMVTAAFPQGSSVLAGDAVVTVTVAGDTAIAGTDFTAVGNVTVTIAADATSGTGSFTLTVTDDTLVEGDETLSVSGTTTASGFTSIVSTSLTITDNDVAPTGITLSLNAASVSVAESSGTPVVTVTAEFTGSSSTLTTATLVTVSVAGNTATAGTDFTAVTDRSVTIAIGATSGTATFNLVVTDDTLTEGDETLSVSGTTTATGFTAIASIALTITDDDIAPTEITLSLNAASVSVTESSGTTTVTVTAAFSGGSTLVTATRVTVSVAADTAEAADFTAVGNVTVTIPANMTSGTASFNLAVTEDTLVEGPETVTVSGAATGITISDVTLTITDNDVAPTAIALSLNPASVSEDSSATSITVTASFSGSNSNSTLTSATAVTVTMAGGTATAETDYTMTPATLTVTIPVNMTSGTASFTLVVTDDTFEEGSETVTLSGSTTATGFGTIPSVTLTITDGDMAGSAIALSLSPTSAEEDTTTAVTVTATLAGTVSRTSATDVTVSVAADTASTADFTAVNPFTVTIPANMLSGTASFNLVVTDDTVIDPGETLTVSGALSSFTITSVTLTITDTDTAPTSIALSLSPTSVTEGATTTVAVTAAFPPGSVTLGSATDVTVSVTGNTATAGTDFTAVTAFTVTIPAGATSGMATFDLAVADDTLVEGNETVTVSGTAASFTITSATLTITDGDAAPTTIDLSLNPTSAAEEATTTVTVMAAYPGGVTLTAATVVTVSVAADMAQATDFTAVSDFMVTIAVGMNSGTATFEFTPTDDEVFTANKTVTVSGTATGYTVTSATLTIDDDETPPAAVTLTAATVGESAGAVTVAATLDSDVVGGLTITVATTNTSDTATAGEDYTTPTVILTFAGTAGEIQTFPVTILGDNVVEGDETFTVSLTAPDTFPDTIDISSTVTVTITDDDAAPTTVILSIAPDQVEEDSGTTTIAVSVAYPGGVTLTTATEVTVSVAGDTADEADFTAVSDFTLTIAVGESSSAGSFDLTVTEDEESEGNETLTVSAAATGLATASAMLTIREVSSTMIVMEVVPELARLSVTSVIDAVADRVGRAVAGTANVLASFAGHQSLAPALAANEQRLNEGDLSWREVLENSSFDLNLEGTDEEAGSGGGQADPSGNVGIWASGGYESVSSQDAQLGAWEGDLFSVHAGVDMRVAENVLVGVAANWSEGNFEFEDDPKNNADTRLTTLNPYLGWNSGEGAGLWATVGYGKGNVEIPGLDTKRDLTMTMAALGGSMDVSVDDEVSLTVKGSASTARLVTAAIDDEPPVTADVQRLRLALEAQGVTTEDAGEKFTRSAALGIRYDGGDGDTGLGAELDGELGWLVPATGVTLRANGHVLLAHQSDLKEWGVGGLIRYDVPGSSEGRGVSLSGCSRPMGRKVTAGSSGSNRSRSWSRKVTMHREPGSPWGLTGGLSALSGRGLLTPYGNLELSEDGERVYRLGGRFEVGPAIHIDLGGDRKEAGG